MPEGFLSSHLVAGVRPGMMNLRIATCNPFKPLLNLPSLWKGHWRSQEVLDFLVTKVKVEIVGYVKR